MVVLFHVVTAIISVVTTTFLLFSPTRKKLIATYILFGITLITGTYLIVFMRPSHMISTCVMGIFYIVFVVAGIYVASMRLVRKPANPQ